jgi:cyclic beta-1,2-glucan synthetase
MYRAGVEGILGIRREGAFLVVDPCIPAAWPGFEATVNVGATRYDIRVENSSQRCRGVLHAVLDGMSIHCTEERIRVPLEGQTHSLLISI